MSGSPDCMWKKALIHGISFSGLDGSSFHATGAPGQSRLLESTMTMPQLQLQVGFEVNERATNELRKLSLVWHERGECGAKAG